MRGHEHFQVRWPKCIYLCTAHISLLYLICVKIMCNLNLWKLWFQDRDENIIAKKNVVQGNAFELLVGVLWTLLSPSAGHLQGPLFCISVHSFHAFLNGSNRQDKSQQDWELNLELGGRRFDFYVVSLNFGGSFIIKHKRCFAESLPVHYLWTSGQLATYFSPGMCKTSFCCLYLISILTGIPTDQGSF